MPNIARTKTWNANETLTAADLNAEFDGILTGVNDNALNNDNLNQTDDYLFGSMILGTGLSAAGGDGKLHVHVASAGSVTAHANGNDFVIEGTANPGMSFLSGASTTNSIYFGDVNDNDAGSIVYTHGTDMAFTVETAEVLTLAAASVTNNVNTFVGNGYGAVIGHTAQETISDGGGATDVVPEFQILGTAAADMTAMIGGWSTTATRAAAPVLALVKSGHASIGSHTVVTDGEILGSIIAYGDDGTDLEAPAAAIEFAVDGTPGTGDMPGEIKFYTTADSGETLTLALTLSAAQAATFAGAVTVASLACTAEGTFGGGYGATGATISTAGVIQANGAITSDGAVTGATLAGTISTATQNSITTATSLASVGTITSGTWSGVIDGSCTMTLGSDATGDIYYRDASGFLEKLAASTDGHVLTSTGAGSIPAWEAGAGTSVGDNLAWTDYVETAADENAQKVIIVDLDDPGTIWDYAQFMQQIQGTSWFAELGAPPMHGLMFITEAQDKLVWWNRETGAAYMTFTAASGNMIGAGTIADAAWSDSKILVAQSDGVYVVDLLVDGLTYYGTTGIQTYKGDVTDRNSASGFTTMATSPAIVNNATNAIAAVRDPSLTDEFNRPKHWWTVGTDGGGSVYNPVDDAIYDSSTTNDFEQINLTATGVLSYPRDNGTRQKWGVIRSIFGIAADAWSADTLWANDRADAEDIAWTNAATTKPYALLDGRSWAEEGMPQVWFGSDEGAYVGHVHSSTNATEGGLIRLTETYASPYMKGDIRGAWPLHSTADVSPGGHTLTNNNSVTFSDGGPAGSYANFDGVNQSLSVADHADWSGMSELSWGCWFWRDTDSGANEGVFGQYNLASYPSWGFYIDTSDNLVASLGTAGGDPTNSWAGLSLGQWCYAVGTYESGSFKLYVNGVLVATNAGGTGTVDDTAAIVVVGGLTNGHATPDYHFDGRIGGAFVSATMMTEREVKAEYARGIRRINSTIDTNDTISDNDVAAIAADPNGKYVAVMGDDKTCNVFDEFAVPVATDTYPGTTARDVAIKSMPGGVRHLIMAGSDQIELVQPDTKIGI